MASLFEYVFGGAAADNNNNNTYADDNNNDVDVVADTRSLVERVAAADALLASFEDLSYSDSSSAASSEPASLSSSSSSIPLVESPSPSFYSTPMPLADARDDTNRRRGEKAAVPAAKDDEMFENHFYAVGECDTVTPAYKKSLSSQVYCSTSADAASPFARGEREEGAFERRYVSRRDGYVARALSRNLFVVASRAAPVMG
jgi:hypothetical protein